MKCYCTKSKSKNKSKKLVRQCLRKVKDGQKKIYI